MMIIKKFKVTASAILMLAMVVSLNVAAQTRDVTITIHLRGVYESKISLLSMAGSRTYKSVVEKDGIKNGETATLVVLKDYLPGACVLRFDYRENATSTPYPSEKNIYVYQQDLELWVRPQYCNNPDSTWFQKGETENAAFLRFSKENGKKKEMIGLLQNFLMNYDDTKSAFYQSGINEYETRRTAYNQWLKGKVKEDKNLFVSSVYNFQYIPQIAWKGSEKDRVQNMIAHYFDGIDFDDPLLIKTPEINKWMDNYVNMYGQMATTTALRDSLFPLAGTRAIEIAKKGNPIVYGWMVDYFYKGYESNAIDAGMKILQPYLDDPNCLTMKRQEISRRLKGMETLVAGSIAPEISLKDRDGSLFELSRYNAGSTYIMVLFWSAGCSHCAELVEQVYPWQQQQEVKSKLDIVAISLDETESEVALWDKKAPALTGWKHLHAVEGVRSKVAADYFVLATPVMVVLDAKSKKIVATPNTLEELKKALK